MEGREAKLAPQVDAALKGKRYTAFSFKINPEKSTLIATLELTDAAGKAYKYSAESTAVVGGSGAYKKIAYPFQADTAHPIIELNMSRHEALKRMLKNLAEGKTVA